MQCKTCGMKGNKQEYRLHKRKEPHTQSPDPNSNRSKKRGLSAK